MSHYYPIQGLGGKPSPLGEDFGSSFAGKGFKRSRGKVMEERLFTWTLESSAPKIAGFSRQVVYLFGIIGYAYDKKFRYKADSFR